YPMVMRRLMLLKPEIVAHATLLEAVLNQVRASALPVISARKLRMSGPAARRFYEAHKGKFFYGRLVRHMSSGESIALVLSSDSGQARSLVGGGKIWPPRSVVDATTANGLRHLFSISDVRNVAHVSDDERAEEELRIIEEAGGEELLWERKILYPEKEFIHELNHE
ncbi:hypothetical protein PMAYCL1PPCAC_21066, partial [Pristionchus mayeri]